MSNRFQDALAQVVAFLEKHTLHYAIIGGIANQIWGQARFTYDIDVKILIPDSDYDAVRSLINRVFPVPGRPGLPPTPLIISVQIDEIIVDFLMAIPGYDEMLVRRAKKHQVEDLSFRVCTAEDLVIQKAIAGRPKDWLDIEGILIEQQSALDWKYIDNWLKQFAEALEDPEILPRYQRLRKSLLQKKH